MAKEHIISSSIVHDLHQLITPTNFRNFSTKLKIRLSQLVIGTNQHLIKIFIYIIRVFMTKIVSQITDSECGLSI